MEKALIIGLGFIAANLAKHLINRGFDVHITYRSIHGSKALMMKDLLELNIKPHKLDPGNYDDLVKLISGLKPNYVFNTVGLLNGSWNELWSAHVEVPRNIARAILSVDKSIKFIHISASAASGKIGNYIKEEPVHCDYSYVRPRSDYERSKCDGERTIKELGVDGLNYVIVRPTLVYGYYNDHNEFLSLYRFVRMGLVPQVRGLINAIYVGYLVEMLERLAVNEEYRNTFLYATECTMYSLGDFAELMAEHLGVGGVRIPLPPGLVGLFLPGGARSLLKYVNVQYDCESTRRVLGNVEPAIDIGVKEMVNWLRRVYG
ncbi:NAD-dependent epimerase/dehydratase family protein [Vulcanisaeta sp. JCM 16161]|uniref:NAD-dependent epimerase/dehydratase family protein n=1 Tax=Vulcanisaeta sp. JCM 16161 TaxID=1295372 RepID=UPI0006D2368B|nr:NAD-dependent epimerase/dehydratase family protein [Vulcanisaeta sp. JCM 16161]